MRLAHFPMVKWDSKADRGDRSPTRSRSPGGGRHSKTPSTREKNPSLPQAHKLATPRGSPIIKKLARHATPTWTTLPVSNQAIQVRPLQPAMTSHLSPCKRTNPPTIPDPDMAQMPLIGDISFLERGPQHIGLLVSACTHRCMRYYLTRRPPTAVIKMWCSALRALPLPPLRLTTKLVLRNWTTCLAPARSFRQGNGPLDRILPLM